MNPTFFHGMVKQKLTKRFLWSAASDHLKTRLYLYFRLILVIIKFSTGKMTFYKSARGDQPFMILLD